jgi:hypothetical protein
MLVDVVVTGFAPRSVKARKEERQHAPYAF